jgi:hypothetical protein
MEYEDLTRFLEKESLFDYVKDNAFYFQNILKNCLNLKKENLLIVSDLGKKEYRSAVLSAAGYYYAAMRLGLSPRLVIQGIKKKGELTEKEVIDALLNLEKGSTVIVSVSGYLGSTHDVTKSFRKFCRKNRHRFVSTTGMLELPTRKFPLFIDCINVDYREMYRKAKKIKKILDKGRVLRIQTMAGTDLVAGIDGMKAIMNVGLYTKPGQGGNIPAGEVYIPPEKDNVNGKVVIDGSIRHSMGTVLVKKPVTITVRDGRVTDIEETAQSKKLIKTLEDAEKRSKYAGNVRRLAEIGIGINPKARIVGPTMINEKTLGTAHVAMGSNAWFGGPIYSIIHLDQVFKKPKIIVDDKLLII